MIAAKEFLPTLKALVEVNSVTGHEGELAKVVREWFTDKGFKAKLQRVESKRYNVIVKSSSGYVDTMLVGHLDTVKPSDFWATDPFKLVVKRGRAYGLGALDMKGGLAINMNLFADLADKLESIKLWSVFYVDEENESLGLYHFLRKETNRFLGAIFTEPFPCDRIALTAGSFGRFAVNVKVLMESKHVSKVEREELIEVLEKVSKALEALNNKMRIKIRGFGQCKYVTTKLQSKGVFFSTPHELILEINHMSVLNETIEKTIEEVEKAFTRNGLAVEVRPTERKTPFLEAFKFDDTYPLVKYAKKFVKDVIISTSVFGGNLTAMWGVPTINIGPTGSNMHKPNEFVNVSSLKTVYSKIYKILTTLDKAIY